MPQPEGAFLPPPLPLAEVSSFSCRSESPSVLIISASAFRYTLFADPTTMLAIYAAAAAIKNHKYRFSLSRWMDTYLSGSFDPSQLDECRVVLDGL